jgi:hypothetical protein
MDTADLRFQKDMTTLKCQKEKGGKEERKKCRRLVTEEVWFIIECSLCRLIRRPEHLIGRHWYLPANWRSFIR